MKKTPPLLFLEVIMWYKLFTFANISKSAWDKGLPNALGFFPDHVCHIPSAPWDASWSLPCLVQLWLVGERRGEERRWEPPSLAVPCWLVPCPVAMPSSALVFSSWSLISCRLFPSALCLVDVTCFYLSISGEAGLAVTALSTGTVVGGRSHHTEQASPSHTLCVHPEHSSAATLLPDDPHLQGNLAQYDAKPSLQNVHGSTLEKCRRKRLIDFLAHFFQESNKQR